MVDINERESLESRIDRKKQWHRPLLTELDISKTEAKNKPGNDGEAGFCPNNDCGGS
jgi:hypothetical protein